MAEGEKGHLKAHQIQDVILLGETLKLPTLARPDSNHLHELSYNRRFW